MGNYFYLTPQNEQKGPVEAHQLQACGVTTETLVWTQGMPQWAPAGSVEELKSLLAPKSAATPPPTPQTTTSGNSYNRSEHTSSSQPSSSTSSYGAASSTTSSYSTSSGASSMPPKPDNNLVWAILSTILCCLPTGIYAIICANDVDKLYFAGDYAGAVNRAKSAMNWSIIGAVGCVVINLLVFLLYGSLILAAIGSASY